MPPMKPKTHHYSAAVNDYSGDISRRRLPQKAHSVSRRDCFVAGIFPRRGLLRYFLPLLYVSGLIMYVAPFSFMMHPNPSPGSVYRSAEIFQKLWNDIRTDNSSVIELSSVWRYKRKLKEQKPCPKTTSGQKFGPSMLARYLVVEANGGLNQQRSSICNAVAVAGLLNVTLVIPYFELHSVWRDPSQFSDIYDEGHFITTLEDYVKVSRMLPEELMEVYDFNISNIPNFRVQAWATAKYYLEEVYPVLTKQRVIRIAPFANRLAMYIPPKIQFLRCLTNYEALRFSLPISTLANKLVNQMIDKSSSTGGKYVSVHLRFEEVGMMLRGMGFGNNTPIYLASGKIYQAERNLAPLLKMFPLLQTKESLAAPDELAPFEDYSSRLAALDYMVCLFSEVFVTTQGGNFPHFLMGHRRFLYKGHSKTIKPDKSQLAVLLQDTNISWKAFKDKMEAMLAESDRKGAMVPRVTKSNRKSSIFSHPSPECKCLWESKNSTLKWTLISQIPNH
ncbi:hypothetical protein CsSME_00014992 [Camellia sinensis var. sinensis]